MIPNVGPLEIAIVLIIALIVFGPKRLPELGRSLGKGINEFKDGLSNVGQHDDEDEEDDDEDYAEPTPRREAISPPPGEDPEITELVNDDPKAEPVESEVVPDRQD